MYFLSFLEMYNEMNSYMHLKLSDVHIKISIDETQRFWI